MQFTKMTDWLRSVRKNLKQSILFHGVGVHIVGVVLLTCRMGRWYIIGYTKLTLAKYCEGKNGTIFAAYPLVCDSRGNVFGWVKRASPRRSGRRPLWGRRYAAAGCGGWPPKKLGEEEIGALGARGAAAPLGRPSARPEAGAWRATRVGWPAGCGGWPLCVPPSFRPSPRSRGRGLYPAPGVVRRLGRWPAPAPQGGALSPGALLAFRCGRPGRQSGRPPSSDGAWLPQSC